MKLKTVIAIFLLVVLGCTHTQTLSTPVKENQPGAKVVVLNDIHSQLNLTNHAAVITPKSVEEIQAAVRDAKSSGQYISISGGKHSMGGQQFGAGTVNLSMSGFNKVMGLDAVNGVVEVQSGIQWPELVESLYKNQDGLTKQWGIRQK